MTLNPDVINGRCKEIEISLARLESVKARGREIFLSDANLQDVACYRLLIAIEAALHLCYHVAAKRLKQVPGEYAECFEILGNGGVIPAELAGRLKKMAQFRNLLIPMYWKTDFEKVFGILENDLGDLREFSRIVASMA